MSDTKINTIIRNSISSIIKKIKIYENVVELKKVSYGFFFVFTFTTGALIINSLYNSYALYNLHKEIDKIEERYTQIIDLLKFNKGFNNSISDISYVKEQIIENNQPDIEFHIEDIFQDNHEELLNECYDNIPCNNIKKVTGF
jgi:cell division protein FtsL